MKFILVIDYIELISHHGLLPPFSSEDKDHLLKCACNVEGPLLPDFPPEPVVKGKVLVNQRTSHSYLSRGRITPLPVIVDQLYLEVNKADSVFTGKKGCILATKLLYFR